VARRKIGRIRQAGYQDRGRVTNNKRRRIFQIWRLTVSPSVTENQIWTNNKKNNFKEFKLLKCSPLGIVLGLSSQLLFATHPTSLSISKPVFRSFCKVERTGGAWCRMFDTFNQETEMFPKSQIWSIANSRSCCAAAVLPAQVIIKRDNHLTFRTLSSSQQGRGSWLPPPFGSV
jgi:hypothetical protein